jgi:hypothetical protein
MSVNNSGQSQKHVGNFSSNNTISGDLELSSGIIANGHTIYFPTLAGTSGQYWRADGGGFTSWAQPGLNDLIDSTITSATAGQSLKYTGSTWTNQAPNIWPVRTYTGTGPITLDSTDYLVSCTTTGNLTINLPAVSTNPGLKFIISKLGAGGTITVTPDGTDKIDTTLPSVDLNAQYDRLDIMSNGDATTPLWLVL